jgi:hypothetical protein
MHCQIALCSLSTGSIKPALSSFSAKMTSPAITSGSLLDRAIFFIGLYSPPG